ncbi:MAG TPA: hypothetical protein VFW11_00245 [Cyclobacteriaceae bacterium]|nr:hypothetical protein [Cyclobacteriaceae bacterium]
MKATKNKTNLESRLKRSIMSEESKNKTEGMFANFGKRVDQFLDELDEAGERLRTEFQGKYDELKETAERLKSESKNKERWKEVEESLTRAGEELKKAFEAAFKKKEEPKP